MGGFLEKVEVLSRDNPKNIRFTDAIDSFMHFATDRTPRQVAIEVAKHARRFHMSHEDIAEFYNALRQTGSQNLHMFHLTYPQSHLLFQNILVFYFGIFHMHYVLRMLYLVFLLAFLLAFLYLTQ